MPLEEMSAEDRALLADPGARAVWDLLAARHPEARLTPDTSLLLDLGVDSIEWINLTLEIGERAGATLDEEAIAGMGTVRDLMRAVVGARAKGQAIGGSVFDDPESILKPEQRRWLAPLNPVQLFLGRLLHKADRIWLRRWFDLTVEGRENLPRTPPFLIAPTHGSFLDPLALSAAFDLDLLRNLQWAGWTGVAFRNRFFRFVMRLAQVVPVDPDRAVLSSIAFAAAILRRGRGLVWFPEGGRSPDGTLQPFKPGIGVLLDRFRVPVVPVLIFGAYEAWPPGQSLPKRHPVRVVILPPLDPAELARTGTGATEAERIASGLRARMQEAISARLSGYPSAPAEPEAIPPRTARG
jgi:long-chain acyl-CoA synthetase